MPRWIEPGFTRERSRGRIPAMPNEIPDGLFPGGPFVVFGRGHCGGRILSEAYFRNDIYMGRLSKKNRDTHGMGLKNPWMIEVAKGAYGYPASAPDERARLERLVATKVEELRKKAAGKPFGWKVGSSIFCIEILLGTHADARVVHLIRDGRDVCLSRLDARLRAKHWLYRLSTEPPTLEGTPFIQPGDEEVFGNYSVVTAPYSDGARTLGVLGVIGPTRMAYERVIPIVDVTARMLSSALSG